MWRYVRIGILLFILASVAQTAWLARARTAEWKTSLRVVVYPIRGDASEASSRYVSGLRDAAFDPLEEFFKREGKNYGVTLYAPVEVSLAPAIASTPPPAPFGGGRLEVIFWSLKMRYWAWWNDTHKGPKPDVRIFVSYHDPEVSSTLAHSTGLQKGLIGVVNAFASADMDGSNNIVIAHELLHTLGATDKYDVATNRPLHPDGYAEPDAQPLYPQRRAEVMAGRIPLSESRADTPRGMNQVVIGAKTAREINWVAQPR
jgi:hypothetical protein